MAPSPAHTSAARHAPQPCRERILPLAFPGLPRGTAPHLRQPSGDLRSPGPAETWNSTGREVGVGAACVGRQLRRERAPDGCAVCAVVRGAVPVPRKYCSASGGVRCWRRALRDESTNRPSCGALSCAQAPRQCAIHAAHKCYTRSPGLWPMGRQTYARGPPHLLSPSYRHELRGGACASAARSLASCHDHLTAGLERLQGRRSKGTKEGRKEGGKNSRLEKTRKNSGQEQ